MTKSLILILLIIIVYIIVVIQTPQLMLPIGALLGGLIVVIFLVSCDKTKEGLGNPYDRTPVTHPPHIQPRPEGSWATTLYANAYCPQCHLNPRLCKCSNCNCGLVP